MNQLELDESKSLEGLEIFSQLNEYMQGLSKDDLKYIESDDEQKRQHTAFARLLELNVKQEIIEEVEGGNYEFR